MAENPPEPGEGLCDVRSIAPSGEAFTVGDHALGRPGILALSRTSAEAAETALRGAREVDGTRQILSNPAQAGEAGKGFAVIAHEVKDLARGTAEANRLIAEVVHQMQEEIRKVVSTMQSIRLAVGELRTLSQEVSTAVEQQAEANASTTGSSAAVLSAMALELDRVALALKV